jgi:hypothetical protein
MSWTDERSRPMGRVAPSVIARQQLQELLSGRAERGSNIVAALVEMVTQVVVQELLEGEQVDFWAVVVAISGVARPGWVA